MVKNSTSSKQLCEELLQSIGEDPNLFDLNAFLEKLAAHVGAKSILLNNDPYIDDSEFSEYLSKEIPLWGQLYYQPNGDFNEEDLDLAIVNLALFLQALAQKKRSDLVNSLTSDVRKTLRPDLALEKIYNAFRDFLKAEEIYFYETLNGTDQYELKFHKSLNDQARPDKFPAVSSHAEIQQAASSDSSLIYEVSESKTRDKVLGFLILGKKTKWTEDERSLLRPFAEQMATVYTQHDLRSESLSMAQREFLLNQVTTTIRKSLDVDEIIKIATEEIAQVLGVEACGVMITNRKMRSRLNQAVWSPRDQYTHQMMAIMRETVDTQFVPSLERALVRVDDFSSLEDPMAKDLAQVYGARSYLSYALYKEDMSQVIGFLSIAFFSHPRSWTQDEEQLIDSIAKQLEMALMQASIYQESQQTKRQMALLHKLSSDIRNSLDISTVMGQIAKGLGEVLGLSRCFVRRLARDNRIMKTEEEYTAENIEKSADVIFDFEREWIEKITHQDVRENAYEFLNVPYLRSKLKAQNASESLIQIVDAIDLKSYLSVPLIARNRVLGTINVHQCDRERNFLAEEIEFISRVGSEAAVAIEHAELFETIDKLNKTDPDTGLYNKQYFRILANREIHKAAEEGKDISFIMLDLDHLKEINDTPDIGGHDAGDEAILLVARALEKTVRQTPVDEVRSRVADVVGRFGGDEYMILLPGTNIHDAVKVAQRIQKNINKAKHSTWPHMLTASIGVAGTPNDKCDYESLKIRADKALYLAKDKGRSTVSSTLELSSD